MAVSALTQLEAAVLALKSCSVEASTLLVRDEDVRETCTDKQLISNGSSDVSRYLQHKCAVVDSSSAAAKAMLRKLRFGQKLGFNEFHVVDFVRSDSGFLGRAQNAMLAPVACFNSPLAISAIESVTVLSTNGLQSHSA